jgi:hypothetical protein
VFFCFIIWIGEGEGSRDGGMGNGILAGDEGAVGKGDGDVVREVCVDGGEDGGVARYGAYAGKKVDGGLERAGEEAGAIAFVRLL